MTRTDFRHIDAHAFDRVGVRLAEERIVFGERALARLDAYAATEDAAAFKLLDLPYAVGAFPESNGNEVWAIVRNRAVRTVMLRRSDQRSTCDTLRVDTVFANPMFTVREAS